MHPEIALVTYRFACFHRLIDIGKEVLAVCGKRDEARECVRIGCTHVSAPGSAQK